LFFNNLVIRHIESSVSQLSLFSLFSTISLLWTQFWALVDTKVDTKNRVNATTKSSLSDGVDLGVYFALSQSKSFFPCLTPRFSRRLGTPLPSRLQHDG
jgi:hypothetical protein